MLSIIIVGIMIILAIFWECNRDDEREEVSQFIRRYLTVGRSD
jgi:hypothetical protein